MKFKNKIFSCFIVSFLFLISSGVVFADEAPAMDLAENGTVSGDAQIISANPWKTSGSLEYTIPDNVEEIKSANVVVSSYSGSGAPTYALYSNISLSTKNGFEILGYEDLFCDVSMTNDPLVYVINNHTTKQYSDYQSVYNITDSVKTLSPGDTIKISVENTRKEGYNFDGRIKIIALTFAYNDADDDQITYWLNLGQSWTQSTRSNLIKTKNFNGEYDEVTFENIALSSYQALCRINNKLIYDPIYEKQGSYFIDQIWNITDNFNVGQDTNFTYKASSSGYGSFKSSMQLLKTIKTFRETPVLYINADKNIFVGENLTIDVSLPVDATGNVSIDDRVNSLENGNASFVISDLAEGIYTFTVKYSGDDKYNPAFNKTIVEVNKVPKVTPVMYLEAKDIVVGENLTIDVTLPEDATGDVSIGDRLHSLENGKASFSILGLDVGTHTFTVKYSGDDKYNPVNNKTTVNVKENKTIVISVPEVVKYFKGPERLNVYLTDLKGNPIGNETVTIDINGVSYTKTTDANGTASMALGLNSGVYDVVTTSDNQKVNSLVTIKSTVNGTDVVKVFRNGTQYYASFYDSNGNYLPEGTTVRFNINGVFYDRQISGNKGLARLNLNLEQGTYVLTAMNPRTGENAANNITIIPKIVENKDLTKYFRNESQYTVKVLGDNGKPVGAGVSVKFNINGVFYERQTNASGIAKLTINLNPGDYIITAEYEGCRVSNNVKILPILSASDLTKKYGEMKAFEAKLVDGTGKPYANQQVQFNINGVFYTRTTDSTGIARLNINLQPGQYIITSMYNNAYISNTVNVLLSE